MKYKTTLNSKAELLTPNSMEFKAVASSLKDKYGFDLKPQMDLLYVRSCLLSAGENVGVNDNDDIFTREEAWAARHTPVLKPFNWQHVDKDIVGVIYTVQAKDLDGNVLDFESETPPDCDFNLWTEAAVFSLIHEDRAAEIKSRAQAGTLFVSMEAWFDDYAYGFCDPASDSTIAKVVSRNESTSFLDNHLRAGGGTGKYRDPELNRDVRLGRVLRDITFGGCGFVDRPANKPSIIEAAEPMTAAAGDDEVKRLLDLLDAQQSEILNQEVPLVMNTQANNQDIETAVGSALDKREKAAAEEQAKAALVERAEAAENERDELQAQNQELNEVKEAKEAEINALKETVEQYNNAVQELVQQSTEAGATDDTPAEIASIDAASDGDAAFAAKLAWIQKSMASLNERAARASELEAELAKAEAVVREQEVRNLFSEGYSEEFVEAMVARAAELEGEAYEDWRDEKELMVLESAEAKMDPEMMKKMKEKKEGKDKGKDKAECSLFAALLEKRRSESGMASPDTPTDTMHLINHPGGEGVKSGVSPEGIRTPRHKVAGSAGADPADLLENAQEEGGVQLAGTQASDESNDGIGNAFRSLANLVTGTEEDDDQADDQPGFDPVQ